MLKTFDIYLKEGGSLKLQFWKFTFDESSFTLYDSYNDQAQTAFLSFEKVAAILPSETKEITSGFIVYLRNNINIKVDGMSFKLDQPPSLKFFTYRERLISDVYVALTEVVAVMPIEGLSSGW
jgi:hypothetical protein